MFKLILCVVLICIHTNVNGYEISDEAKEKIHNLIGVRQDTLRSFLAQVKIDTIRFGNDMRSIENEAKGPFVSEVDKIINKVQADKTCVDQLRKQSETTQSNCVSTAKPNLADYNKAFAKHSEFQSKIGETVQKCKTSNNDVESAVKCIEKSLEDIGKEMKDSENTLQNTIQEVQKGVLSMKNTLDNCQNQGLKDLQNKAKQCH